MRNYGRMTGNTE